MSNDPLPEPSDKEKKDAEDKVEEWLKKKGYPSPKPEKQ